MKKYFLPLLAALVMACQTQPTEKAEPTKPFAEFLEEYYLEYLKYNPFEATSLGIPGYNHLYPNLLSQPVRNQMIAEAQRFLNELQQYNREKLSADEQISYDVLAWQLERLIADAKHPKHLLPIDQMWSPHLAMGQMASGQGMQPFNTVEDYKNWLMRVDGYVAWCDTAIANMRKGIDMGIVLPKSLIVKTIPQLEELAAGPTEEHLYFMPVKNFPSDFSDDDKTMLTQAYLSMVEDMVMPAHNRLAYFMKNEYLPAGRESSGIGAVPGGETWYADAIVSMTTTRMTADEVFELGQKEVARILAEMEKVKEQVGFAGDMRSFFDYVRNKPELMPFKKPEEVIANFNAIHERMMPALNHLFDVTPKTPFEVRRTEAFREKSASAQYNNGSLDGTRPGIFYVPIPDVSKYNVFMDEALFLHEAIPGHHYQISLQQENESLPSFRKSLWVNPYGEGWALYTEALGTELGLYTDPYQYFGMLSMEMHRAIRLVVDAGMHAKGWTREEAIEYSLNHEAEGEESIISEIERYMALPGQALGYKVGQLKILELRANAEKELGEKFDIRAFHNLILESGCIPLEVLEHRVNEWIKKK